MLSAHRSSSRSVSSICRRQYRASGISPSASGSPVALETKIAPGCAKCTALRDASNWSNNGAVVVPLSRRRRTKRPRSATTRAASATPQTPVTTAATSSPTPRPMTASAAMPHECHSFAIAYCRAKSVHAGWSVASRSEAAFCCTPSASAHSSIAARNVGCVLQSSRVAVPLVEPCPAKTNATRGPAFLAACPLVTDSAVCPAANAVKLWRNSSLFRATAASR